MEDKKVILKCNYGSKKAESIVTLSVEKADALIERGDAIEIFEEEVVDGTDTQALQTQLDEKDAALQALQTQLDEKDAALQALEDTDVDKLKKENAALKGKITKLENAAKPKE